MKKYLISSKNIPFINKCVACIGYFDGVHLGHQKLINETISLSEEKHLKASIIFFDPDPCDIIFNVKNSHLLSYKNKLKIIEYYGIEEAIIIKFDYNIMKLSPRMFIFDYLNKMNIDTLVYGFDFSFAYMSLGSEIQLKKYGNFNCVSIKECKYYGNKISSSRIKESLLKGNFRLINKLLGYRYFIEVIVLKCSKNGKKWLIEAELTDKQCILPKNRTYSNDLIIIDDTLLLLNDKKIKTGTILLLDLAEYE